MKKSLISLLTAFLVLFSTSAVFAAGFTDMLNSKGEPHWSTPHVNDIVQKGLVSGYADGTYRPNNPVSRVEAIVFMSRLHPQDKVKTVYEANKTKWQAKLDANKIPDYARAAIVFALENNWFGEAYLKEFINTSNNAQKAALRYEFCVYLVRSMDWESQKSNAAVVKYTDTAKIVSQAIPYIELLGRKGVIGTTGDFNPNNAVTRGETAKMISISYPDSARAKAEGSGNNNNNNNNNSGNTGGSVTMPSGVVTEGKIESITSDAVDTIIVIKDKNDRSYNFKNKTEAIVVSIDGKASNVNSLKLGYSAKFYTDGITVKGIEASSVIETINKTLTGSVLEAGSTYIKIKTSNGQEEYNTSSSMTINKNGKSARLSELVKGDEITIKIEKSLVTSIEAKTVKMDLRNVVIMGINIKSSGYADVTVADEDGELYELSLTPNSAIFKGSKKVNISEMKIGLEADVYTNSNEILDLTLFGMTKGSVFAGKIEKANLREDYFYIKLDSGKSVKVNVSSTTEIIEYLTNKPKSVYDLSDGMNVVVTGFEGISAIESTKVSYY